MSTTSMSTNRIRSSTDRGPLPEGFEALPSGNPIAGLLKFALLDDAPRLERIVATR